MQTDNIKKQGYYWDDNNFICYRWLAISVFCSVLSDYIRRRLIFVSKGVCFTCFAPLSWCVGINIFDCNRLVAKVLWWIVIFFWCKSLPIQKKVVLLHPISKEKSSKMSRIRLVVQDNCLSRSRSPVRLWYAVRKAIESTNSVAFFSFLGFHISTRQCKITAMHQYVCGRHIGDFLMFAVCVGKIEIFIWWRFSHLQLKCFLLSLCSSDPLTSWVLGSHSVLHGE